MTEIVRVEIAEMRGGALLTVYSQGSVVTRAVYKPRVNIDHAAQMAIVNAITDLFDAIRDRAVDAAIAEHRGRLAAMLEMASS